MKRVIAISAALVVTCASLASAQGSMTKPLVDVAKAEEARREQVKKPSKVITNKDLRPDITKGIAPTTVTPVTDSTAPANATPGAPAGSATPAAGAKQDQAAWAARMKEARDRLSRSQLFAD